MKSLIYKTIFRSALSLLIVSISVAVTIMFYEITNSPFGGIKTEIRDKIVFISLTGIVVFLILTLVFYFLWLDVED